jgi:hypothetical protein
MHNPPREGINQDILQKKNNQSEGKISQTYLEIKDTNIVSDLD